MKKLFVLGLVTWVFLTGCSVNFMNGTINSKYQVSTYEEFEEVKKDLDSGYFAVERIENMSLKDVDAMQVSTIFEDIEVIYEDRKDVEIQYFGFFSDKLSSDEPEYNVSTSGKFVFEVEWRNLIGANYGKMRIFVPEKYEEDFTIKSISGSIEGRELFAKDTTVKSTSGKIAIDLLRVEDLDISSISGSINIEDIKANDVTLSTTSGSISVRKVESDELKMSSISGKLKIEEMKADDVYLDTTSGSVIVSNAENEAMDIKTLSGRIEYTLEEQKGDIKLNSTSGDVDLEIKRNPNGKLDLRSTSGDVNCAYEVSDVSVKKDNKLKGTVGNGKYDIEIKTISGDIDVN
ncbi:MAG: DUF4097 family beta strand repeat protein [Clostridiales bacterium]|nr:DUF4097 family beta strand repeat protein [Clostridiales bacterium]